MKVLAVDPSSRSLGWAVWPNTLRPASYGIVKPHGTLDARLAQIIDRLDEAFDDSGVSTAEPYVRVTHLAVEMPWIGKNPQSALVLGQVVGAVKALALRHLEPDRVLEVQPAEWQRAVFGPRRMKRDDLKRAAIRFCQTTYGLTVTEDIADAILIGYYASSELNWQERTGGGVGWKTGRRRSGRGSRRTSRRSNGTPSSLPST